MKNSIDLYNEKRKGENMKKIFCLILLISVNISVWAQMKTSFNVEKRPNNNLPTGMVNGDIEKTKNAVDVKLAPKTKSISRFRKVNINGEFIPDSFLFYRNVLSDKQKDVYDQVYKALMKKEQTVMVQSKIYSPEVQSVLDAVRYDNPEAFWWSGSFTWWYNSDDIVTQIDLHFWLDENLIDQYSEEFQNMTTPIIHYASNLPDDMTKIKYVHDYICLSTEYDYESFNAGKIDGKLQTAYTCAVEYKTVCAGYSSCFAYYMQQLGIPCVSVWGSGHQWNFLQVNGQYYQMDVTWDDTQLIPTYYNLRHEEMQSLDSHTPTELAKAVIDGNPSTSNSMTYVNYHGMLLEGSPYTYQELAYYNYQNPDSNGNNVYTEKPRKIPVIKSFKEYVRILDDAAANCTENNWTFYCSTKRPQLYDEIVQDFNNDGTSSDVIFYYYPNVKGYNYNCTRNNLQPYTLMRFDIEFY